MCCVFCVFQRSGCVLSWGRTSRCSFTGASTQTGENRSRGAWRGIDKDFCYTGWVFILFVVFTNCLFCVFYETIQMCIHNKSNTHKKNQIFKVYFAHCFWSSSKFIEHTDSLLFCFVSYDTWVSAGEVESDVEDPLSTDRPWKVRRLLPNGCFWYWNLKCVSEEKLLFKLQNMKLKWAFRWKNSN